MRMTPRAALCQCVCGPSGAGVTNNLVRRTTIELNMKASIIYTWLVKTLHNVLSSFALSLVLFLPSWLLLYFDFIAFLFSVSPTVGCIQHSTPQNTYVVEGSAALPVLHCQEVPFFPIFDWPPSLVWCHPISSNPILSNKKCTCPILFCQWEYRVRVVNVRIILLNWHPITKGFNQFTESVVAGLILFFDGR